MNQTAYTRQQHEKVLAARKPHEATITMLKKYGKRQAVKTIGNCIELELNLK